MAGVQLIASRQGIPLLENIPKMVRSKNFIIAVHKKH